MLLKPLIRLFREGRLSIMAGVTSDLKSFYRLSYLAAAGQSGLLNCLASGPATLAFLAQFYAIDERGREALVAWLQMGVRLQLLSLGPRGYALRGLARKLARPENDAVLALAQEVVGLHHQLITATIPKLRDHGLWSLADQDGELIARSSRVLEPFQSEIIKSMVPDHGAVRLLEIGCGSGVYLRHAAERNPSLTAVGLELQPAVAEMARANLGRWGLDSRVEIETGDIREMSPEAPFDIATLYNNIYYFPVAERVALLRHIGGFLRPGGFLLLTTCCQDGSVTTEALNLWGASTDGCGRLPSEEELVTQLREAGYATVRTNDLLPGDRFVAFQAFRN